MRCPNGSNLALHHDVLLARPTNDDEPLALEQRHGAGMSPVRVMRRQRRVRLHQPAAPRADRLERAAKRGTGDTAPAPTDDGNEAGDAPAYAGTQGRDASVEVRGAGQWQLLGRAELAPPERRLSNSLANFLEHLNGIGIHQAILIDSKVHRHRASVGLAPAHIIPQLLGREPRSWHFHL